MKKSIKSLTIKGCLFTLIISCIGHTSKEEKRENDICGSYLLSFKIYDYRDSVNTEGNKVKYLVEAENWSNDDSQHGYGYKETPDSILVKMSIFPDVLVMEGLNTDLNPINIEVDFGLKFGKGMDCININNPTLKKGLIKRTFKLERRDFEEMINTNSVNPVIKTFNVPIANLVEKNKPWYLNQIVISTIMYEVNRRDNKCKIEFFKPTCAKSIERFPSPY